MPMEKNNASGGKTVLFAIIFNLAVQVAFSFVMVAVMTAGGYSSLEQIPYYSTCNLTAMLLLQMAFFAAIVFTKPALVKIPVQSARKWAADIGFALAAAAICLTCFSWLGEWFAVLLDAVGYNLSSLEINGAADILLAVTVTVLLAPVMEETLFRNALTGDLIKTHGTLAASALSGLAFSLMHMSPQQTVYQFFLGAVCAYAFIKTGNIVCPMLIHALNNACAIAVSFAEIPLITPAEGSVSVLTDNIALSIPVTLLLAVAGAGAVYFIGRLFGGDAVASDGTEDKGKIPRTVAVVICASMWLFNFFGSLN